ncbi:MAG: T9SS type A sorting domain-containing protein [Saprospiraceae bacterium]|nr:T9SS type A sorting domain-containing protein [Saprospiraceae bacterium]MBK7789083.1 T9SS type A sorting domain-containing protein [Saprospiraceae bacterium]MBK8110462.1 T9SS type A sorting domain-containing protein [Saprospiraceae bacterium]MBK8849722.1 T9SS type A sorting domain-containing protein [Saprospiraceae bacterium]
MKRFYSLFIFTVLATISLFGQQFNFEGNDPFGLQYSMQDSSRAALKSLFNDMDGDGDYDVIHVGIDSVVNNGKQHYSNVKYFIDYQENTGTKYAPEFASRLPFMPDFPFTTGYFSTAAGDLNQDGLVDFWVCCDADSSLNLKSLLYYRNDPSGSAPFSIIDSDSLRLNSFVRASIFLPDLTDLDMDGDLDLLMCGYQTELSAVTRRRDKYYSYMYAKNIGSPSNPVFKGWYPDPYGLNTSNLPTYATSGDIDNDLDMDILTLTQLDTFEIFSFLENVPQPNGKPFYPNALNDPFGLPRANRLEGIYGHSLVDIDADGDLDLFAPQRMLSTGTAIGFYKNNLCEPSILEMNASICAGDSVLLAGQVFKTTGEYFISIEKANRCDSTIHFSLTVLPSSQLHLEKTICFAEAITVGGNSFSESGQFSILLTNQAGCDSTVFLDLMVLPELEQDLKQAICDGDELVIGSQIFTESGQYNVMLTSANGCDSLVNLDLTVNPTYQSNVEQAICEGNSFTIGNQSFSQQGQYEVKLATVNGCDSVIMLKLSFIPLNIGVTHLQNSLKADMEGLQYQWIDCGTGTNIAGATAQSFTPTANGSYAVILTDNNACADTSMCVEFVLSSTTGMNISNRISIYPNPTNEYINIYNNSGQQLTSIKILNSQSQHIKTITNPSSEKISMSDLEEGNYILELLIGGQKVIKKLTVIRE